MDYLAESSAILAVSTGVNSSKFLRATSSAIRYIRALGLILALSLALSKSVLALDDPEFSLSVDVHNGEPSLLLLPSSTDGVDGFNVYRDDQYLSTHRGAQIRLPAIAGSYCLVSFSEQTATSPVQYSRCSATAVVSPADIPADTESVADSSSSGGTSREPATAIDSTIPSGLVAEVYSGTALELYWDAVLRPQGQTPRFEIFRDGVLIGETAGNSYWVAGLDPDSRYSFRVAQDNGSTVEAGAVVELEMVRGRYQGSAAAVVAGEFVSEPGGGDDSANNVSARIESEWRATNPSFTYYSDTVAELFWQHAERLGEISGYQILRDGVDVGFTNGTSFFQGRLIAGESYSFEIVTLDNNGVAVADVGLEVSRAIEAAASDSGSTESAASGNSAANPDNDASASQTEAAGSNVTEVVVSGTSASAISISSLAGTVELEEGAASVLEIPVTIERASAVSTPVQLTAQALDDWPGSPLQVGLGASELGAGVQRMDTALTVSLPVGRRPLTSHQRRVRITARDASDGQSVSFDVSLRIIPVRAADIYLLIGQSNMEGFSLAGTREAFPGGQDESVDRIRQLNVTSNNIRDYQGDNAFTDAATIVGAPRLIVAEDPLHELRFPFQSVKSGNYIGPGLSFARAMLEQTSQEIILVPAAWSATGFCGNDHGNLGWNSDPIIDPAFAGTQLFDRAMARLALAISESNGIFRGVLWHQGEADSNNQACSSAYQDNLEKLIRAIRSEAAVDRRGSGARSANADIPFIVATMSRGDDERGNFSVFSEFKQRVDLVHRGIENRVPFAAFVNNDDLVPPAYPCGNSSCVHFGAAAYREMGRRYAQQLQQIWQQ